MVTVSGTVARVHLAPAALVGGTKVVGGAAIVALNVWVAQRLDPAAYGLFAIASTAMLTTDGIAGSALDAAVVRAVGTDPAAELSEAERAGVLLKLVAGGLVTLLAVAIGAAIGTETAMTIGALAGAGGTGLLVHRSLLVYLQLRERFGWFAAIDLLHTVLRCVLLAAAVNLGSLTAAAGVAAYAAAPWLTVAVMQTIVAGWWMRPARVVRSAGFAAVRRFASASLATTAVGALVARLDILLIGIAADTHEAGIFGAAATLALVSTWLGAYLAPAFTARILPYCRERRMRPFLASVQRVLIALALAGTAVGALLSSWVVAWLLPPAYAGAGTVVAVLLLAGAAGFVTFPLVLHTLLFLSPRTYLTMDLVSVPLLVPAYVFAARRFGALGVAWVTATAAVIKAVIAQAAAFAAVRKAEAL